MTHILEDFTTKMEGVNTPKKRSVGFRVYTVDERNPARVDTVNIQLFSGFHKV